MNLAVGRIIRSHTIGVAAQYARSFYDVVTNRRKYDRTPISGKVRVRYAGLGIDCVHVCSCVDGSPSGMAIDCPDWIQPETTVEVQADENGAKHQARVCYCQQRGATYRIGLEFNA